MRFRFILLAVGIIYITAFFYFQRWRVNIIQGGDAWGYYAYLPSLFIYGDLSDMKETYLARFSQLPEKPYLPEPGDVLIKASNGRSVNKYTAGVSVLELPFFLLGHGISLVLGYPTDGYSMPYIIIIHFACFFYVFLGMYLLYLPLNREAGKGIAGITILIIALGSGLYHFTVYRGPMAHSFLFFLYSLLIFSTWKFYQSPNRKNVILIGLSAGLITLIRPVEFVCLAIPLFYGLGADRSLSEQWKFWRTHFRFISLAIGVFALCGLIQMLYWKVSSGQWIFYSYGEERFYFNKPKIGPGLFGFQNGWLPYSPVMVLSLFGLVYLFRHRRWLISVLIFLPLHVYFAYSWWCWYYINGVGSRPMVEATPLLAFPLAWFLYHNLRQVGMRVLVITFILFCTVLNIFQTWQHHRGILWTEFGNAGYYWSVFGKTKMDKSMLIAFDSGEIQPDTSRLEMTGVPVWKDYENPDQDSFRVIKPGVFNSRHALKLVPGGSGSMDMVNKQLAELGLQGGDYVRVKAWCKKEALEFPWHTMPAFVCRLKKKDRFIKNVRVRIDNKLDNTDFSLWGGKAGEWALVDFYYRIPINARENDTLQVYIELQRQILYIDDFALEAWKRKPENPK